MTIFMTFVNALPQKYNHQPLQNMGRVSYVVLLGVIALGIGGLAGCTDTRSLTQTITNPSGWFGAESTAARSQAQNKPYPELAKISQSPFEGDVKREYENLANELKSDSQLAKYSGEELRKAIPNSKLDSPSSPSVTDKQALATAKARPEPEITPPPTAQKIEQFAKVTPQPPPQTNVSANPKPVASAATPASNIPASVNNANNANNANLMAGGVITNQQLAGIKAMPSQKSAEQNKGRLLANLVYPQNTISLQASDGAVLSEVVRFFKQYDVHKLYIVGHASPSDASGFTSGMLTSYKMSLDRASKVGEKLVSLGIPQSAIQVDARGGNQPLYAESTRNGVVANRRVEIYVEF